MPGINHQLGVDVALPLKDTQTELWQDCQEMVENFRLNGFITAPASPHHKNGCCAYQYRSSA